MDEPTKFLSHYGVPGMRWGKRKAISTSPVSNNKKTKTASSSKKGSFIAGLKEAFRDDRNVFEKARDKRIAEKDPEAARHMQRARQLAKGKDATSQILSKYHEIRLKETNPDAYKKRQTEKFIDDFFSAFDD